MALLTPTCAIRGVSPLGPLLLAGDAVLVVVESAIRGVELETHERATREAVRMNRVNGLAVREALRGIRGRHDQERADDRWHAHTSELGKSAS